MLGRSTIRYIHICSHVYLTLVSNNGDIERSRRMYSWATVANAVINTRVEFRWFWPKQGRCQINWAPVWTMINCIPGRRIGRAGEQPRFWLVMYKLRRTVMGGCVCWRDWFRWGATWFAGSPLLLPSSSEIWLFYGCFPSVWVRACKWLVVPIAF